MFWGQRQSRTFFVSAGDTKIILRSIRYRTTESMFEDKFKELHTECSVDQHLEDEAGTRVHVTP